VALPVALGASKATCAILVRLALLGGGFLTSEKKGQKGFWIRSLTPSKDAAGCQVWNQNARKPVM
jgi:hypothetical protein